MFLILTSRKVGDRKYQGVRAETYQIQTLDFKHCTRAIYFICCKVRIQWGRSVDHFPTRTFFSHEAVMTMEIEFLNSNFTEKNPKLLMEHIRRMASGGAPFFSTTLSLIYDKLVEKAFPQTIATGSGLGQSPGTGGEGVMNSTNQALNPTGQVSNSTTQVSNLTNQVPGPANQMTNSASNINPPSTSSRTVRSASGYDLYEGLRCPICPERTAEMPGRPYVICQFCGVPLVPYRIERMGYSKKKRRGVFR